MKRTVFIITILLIAVGMTNGQTQHGVVKTKGRKVNGKIVAGKGLPNATVFIKGGSRVVVEKDNGSFSFEAPAKTYMIDSVKKKGYELLDADILRTPQQSSNPLYLVMETQEQLRKDFIDAQEKIIKALKIQKQKALSELEQLKNKLKITEEEYTKRSAQLEKDEDLEKQIASMAKEYSKIDYDQIDEFTQRIGDAILNGELPKALSMLHSRGDINSRILEVRKAQQAESQREIEIAKQQEELTASKEGNRKKIEYIAQDCKNYFNCFIISHQYDSAAYYIEIRADLDSTNIDWQKDAGNYSINQNEYPKAEKYFSRILLICEKQSEKDHLDTLYSKNEALYNLASIYLNTDRFTESEKLFYEAIDICKQLALNNPQKYDYELALALFGISNLYYASLREEEAEQKYKEALDVSYNAKEDPRCTRLFIKSITECPFIISDDLFDKVEIIYNQFVSKKEQIQQEQYAKLLLDIANFYSTWRNNTIDKSKKNEQDIRQTEQMYNEAIRILRFSARKDQLYKPQLAYSIASLGRFYSSDYVKRYDTSNSVICDSLLHEAYYLYKDLHQNNPNAYKPSIADVARWIGYVCLNDSLRYEESEKFYQEAIDLFQELSKVNPDIYERELGGAISGLALLYENEERYSDSEKTFKDALAIFKRLSIKNPVPYLSHVAQILKYILNLYSEWDNHNTKEEEYMLKEIRDVYCELAQQTGKAELIIDAFHYFNSYENLLLNYHRYQEIYDYLMEIYPHLIQNTSEIKKLGERYYSELYNFLERKSYYELLLRKYSEAEKSASKGLEIMSFKDGEADPNDYFLLSAQMKLLTDWVGSLLFQGKFVEAKKIYIKNKEVFNYNFLNDIKSFSKRNIIPMESEADIAQTLNIIAKLHRNLSAKMTMKEEALNIYRRLVDVNPKSYEPPMAQALTEIAEWYIYIFRYSESEIMYKEALAIYRRMAETSPQDYNLDIARILGNLSFNMINLKKFAEAEQYAREGLAADFTQHWIAVNLAAALLFQGNYDEAEKIYHQYKDELKETFLDGFKRLAEADIIPEERKEDVERIKRLLTQ